MKHLIWQKRELNGYQPRQGEVNNEPSVTVEGEVESLRDILTRQTLGEDFSGLKKPYYEDMHSLGNYELNQISKMDALERLDYLKQLSTDIKSVTKQLEQDRKAELEAQAELKRKAEQTKIPEEEQQSEK